MKKIKVSDLLTCLNNMIKSIEIKKKYLYENEIINLQKELNISYNNAKSIVYTVYSESLDNKYKKHIEIIGDMGKNLLNNYYLEDIYTLNNEEYLFIYKSNI